MASWSTRRKYGYLFILIVIMALLIGVPAFFIFYKAPTCFDGKKNGNEHAIDCGGSCAKLCPFEFTTPKVLWSYSMRVVPGLYNALAYIQNPNQGVEAKSVTYLFKFYDDKGVFITERTGKAFVPAGQKFAVFEGAINTGVRTISRTTFEFTEVPAWRPGVILTQLKTLTTNVVETGAPQAEVSLRNETVDKSFSNVLALIILYDKDDNRVAFSKTVIENINPGESQSIFFTWQEPFLRPIVRTEVLFVSLPNK